MEINLVKVSPGSFVTFDDVDTEKSAKLPLNEPVAYSCKLPRNKKFHGKVFAFLQYAFSHYDSPNEHMSEAEQFDHFRKDLTILAGYYVQYVNLNGNARVEAKSLSFGSMDDTEFKECYSSLINAALKHVFRDTSQETYNKLLSFF